MIRGFLWGGHRPPLQKDPHCSDGFAKVSLNGGTVAHQYVPCKV
jgi:hypothetical protein